MVVPPMNHGQDARATLTDNGFCKSLGDAESDRSGRPGETSKRIRLALGSENIEARPVWKPMHLQPVFRGVRTFGGGVAERLFSRGLCLHSGTAMTGSDCDEVCAVIRRVLDS